MMRTEKEKMLAGEMYNPTDPVLLKEREEARRKVRLYNQTLETEGEKRNKLLKDLTRFHWRKRIYGTKYTF